MITVRELTPRAPGAVSILELRGSGVPELVASWTERESVEAGALFVTRLRGPKGDLDEALVVARDREHVELHLHGSPPLVEEVLEVLGERWGAVAASDSASESIEERAREGLASAASELGARLLLDQAEGALRRELEALLAADDAALLEGLRALHAGSLRSARFLRPTRGLLLGPVNAGKSTLFNALVGEERALISERAGTTRDLVRAEAALGPWPVEWIDSAGQRALEETSGQAAVEREGQQRALDVTRECDWVLWLSPEGEPAPALEGFDGPVIALRSHVDEAAERGANGFSALRDPGHAVDLGRERFEAAFGLAATTWTPGAAVLFDDELRARVAEWLEAPAAEIRVALRDRLAVR